MLNMFFMLSKIIIFAAGGGKKPMEPPKPKQPK